MSISTSKVLARSCAVWLLALPILTGRIAQAQTPARRPVGIVVSISPYPGQTVPGKALVRSPDGAERPLGEGEFVSENDEIIVPNRDATVVVSERRGSRMICAPQLTSDACRLVLTSENSFLGPIGRFYDSIVRITSRMTGGSSTFATLSSRTFDDLPMSVMVDVNVGQTVRTGERALWLTWSGGKPPFRLELSLNSRRLLEQSTQEREITLPPVQLVRGQGSLSCRDAVGQEFSITIVASDRLPDVPDLSAAASSTTVTAYLAAAWLSQQGDGRFKFEAVQQLSGMARDLHVADSLRRGLMLLDPAAP
ncbi:hypothetical protein [Bradyrhizobium sp. 21]|uniref:hypothetical protein n=1 Tax=Bradyrhizobium sp. 21 TaxID=2782666 RepID=UPI001FF71B2D|nr:hypothetical protein [Bradyrhizobium sp. 21]MCK1389038.1 hypothetical protein [Bradyrhizobium sp. 21]